MGLLRLFKCAFNCIAIFVIFAIALVVLPGLPPHNVQFTAYENAPSKKLEGPLKLNTKLNNAERLFENILKGPESLISHEGVLYASVHGGLVVKIVDNTLIPFVKFGKPCAGIHEERICGRPLGMYLDSKKDLYVADAYYGIFKVNISTGEVIQIIHADTVIEGRKANLFNSIVVASDGKIFWTDSDSNFDLENLGLSMFADGTGRLIKYDPLTRTNSVLMDRLHMANGVAMATDESYLLVAESSKFRVHKYYLKGSKKGNSEVWIDGLPGIPDNLKADGQGNFYISLLMARDEDLQPYIVTNMSKYPLLRKFMVRFMAAVETIFSVLDSFVPHVIFKKAVHAIGHCETLIDLFPQIPRVTILKVNGAGIILDSYYATDGHISAICDVEFHKDYVYLASPFNNYLARVKKSKFA